jgi:hypothetical protein
MQNAPNQRTKIWSAVFMRKHDSQRQGYERDDRQLDAGLLPGSIMLTGWRTSMLNSLCRAQSAKPSTPSRISHATTGNGRESCDVASKHRQDQRKNAADHDHESREYDQVHRQGQQDSYKHPTGIRSFSMLVPPLASSWP